jgi:hypothetical protein
MNTNGSGPEAPTPAVLRQSPQQLKSNNSDSKAFCRVYHSLRMPQVDMERTVSDRRDDAGDER